MLAALRICPRVPHSTRPRWVHCTRPGVARAVNGNTDYHWCRVVSGRQQIGGVSANKIASVTTLYGIARPSVLLDTMCFGYNYRGEHASAFHLRLPTGTR